MTDVLFDGFNSKVATFISDVEFEAGDPVAINSSTGALAAAGDGDYFIGFCCAKRDNLVTVQLEGYYETVYTGTAPTCGWCSLAANGSGGVKAASGAPQYRVITIEKSQKLVGIIL